MRSGTAAASTLKPYQPSPIAATRRSAASLLPPTTTGTPRATGFGYTRIPSKRTNSPANELTSSRHSVRSAATYSAVRRPRPAKGTPSAANSSADQPTPTPSVQPPAGEHVQRGGLLGHDHRVVLGEQQHAGGELDAGGHGGREGEGEERVEPVGVGGHGDAPVGRVRVPRRLRVEHHDVLARPQRGEPVLFGAERHGADDLRSRARADAERVQAQPHAESPIVA